MNRKVLQNIVQCTNLLQVAVGSGWNQEQRIRYQKNPSELIGKTITVQYFEESKNQQGGLSLRFPTVKHVFENGRNC